MSRLKGCVQHFRERCSLLWYEAKLKVRKHLSDRYIHENRYVALSNITNCLQTKKKVQH